MVGGLHFFSTLITQKSVFAIWGLCWYNFFSLCCEDWRHQGKQAREIARLRKQKKKVEGTAHVVTNKTNKMGDRWKDKI